MGLSNKSRNASNNTIQGHRPDLFTGQTAAILEILLQNRGEWVPACELSRRALQYNARIFTLRRDGYTIENKVERVAGKVHGSFRLVACPTEPPLHHRAMVTTSLIEDLRG